MRGATVYRWVWGLLMALAVLVGCRPGPGKTPTPTPEPDLAPVGFSSQDWIQTSVADFESGSPENLEIVDQAGGEFRLARGQPAGVYTSIEVAAEFSFNAIVAHWRAEMPRGTTMQVELRVQTEEGWWPWHPVSDAEWIEEQQQFYPETPLLLVGGRGFQYRVTMTSSPSGASPVLDEMTLTFMDTSLGPTTAQAKLQVKVGEATADGVPQPGIIPRAGWGADESYLDWSPEYQTVRKIVVHHTVTPNDYDEEQSAAWVRAIYYYHAVT